jgi:enamine deaminase RidA (YjgF/YER057c/UK114 family)
MTLRAAALLASTLAAACVAVSDGAAAEPPPAAAKTAIVPEGMEWAPDSLGFSPALISGDLVFVSGEVAVIRDAPINAETMEAAFRGMFERLGRTLNEAGADWDDVVEMTTFHTDMPAQIDIFLEVKDEFIDAAPYPSWTAIDIDRLYPDAGIAEMKLVARIGGR